MKSVIVTGGAGYIGSHCCKELALQGFLPVVYDNLSTGHQDFVKWGPLVRGDVRNRDELVKVIETHRPVAILHFAAHALVAESVLSPAKYWDVNVSGTLALLEAMRLCQMDKLVFSSTCAVYGEPTKVPISEKASPKPVNPYGASKLAAERLIEDFGHAHGIRSMRLRYFNASGADPDGGLGEDHTPETHLIPLVLDAATGRSSCVTVFGGDYPTPDGTAVRDYIHVNDLASAHIASIRYLLQDGRNAVLNVGAGRGVSVAQVLDAAERAVGRRISRMVKPRRMGDPACLVANPTKAQRVLDWVAARSDIDQIVMDAWRWHQKRFATGGVPNAQSQRLGELQKL
jgi:UDP-glucose-4-epimerase GalE